MTQEQAIDLNSMDDASLMEAIDAGLFSDTGHEETIANTDSDSPDDDVLDDNVHDLDEDTSEEGLSDSDGEDSEDSSEDEEDQDGSDGEEELTDVDEDDVGEEDTEEIPQETLKEVYDRLFAPFRAAGQTVQVNNVDEAIKLMQQGVDYYKKTRELAKYSRTVHLLEKHGLTSEEDIGYIIDLVNKDPKAISKLLKESNIDVMDLDLDSEADYTPSNYSMSDQELELRTVLSQNLNNRDFQSVVDDVKGWDTASRQLVSEHPKLLEILSEDYASGAYQQVMAELTKRQALGQLEGLSMIQAYRQVVEEWSAPANIGKQPTASNPQPNAKDSDRQRRRKSASPAPRTVTKQDEKVLETPQELYAMSDDELDKLLNLVN